MFKTATITSEILDRAKGISDITPLKLSKLLYTCNGWHLAFMREPLIDSPIMAWPYGPMIEPVYHEYFKAIGNNPINEQPKIYDVYSSDWKYMSIKDECKDEKTIDFTLDLIDRVLDTSGTMSPIELGAVCSQEGTPWSVFTNNGTINIHEVIPDTMILTYFLHLLNNPPSKNVD